MKRESEKSFLCGKLNKNPCEHCPHIIWSLCPEHNHEHPWSVERSTPGVQDHLKLQASKRTSQLEQTFLKKMCKWATSLWKKCSTSQITEEMRIKTTVSCHLTPVMFAIIQKTKDNECWQGSRAKGALGLHWECTSVQPWWGTVWRFCRKLCLDPPRDPAVPILDVYPENWNQYVTETPALPCSSQQYSHSHHMKTVLLVVSPWMGKENVVQLSNGILPSL